MNALIIVGCIISYVVFGVINTKLMYKYNVWDSRSLIRWDNAFMVFNIVIWPVTFFGGTFWLLLASPIMPIFRWTRSWIIK